MNIGVDIDDTLTDFVTPFIKWYSDKHNVNIRFEDITDWNYHNLVGQTADELMLDIQNFYQTDIFCEKMVPFKGIEQSLKNVSKLYNLYPVTARTPNTSKATETFMTKYFDGLMSEVIYSDNKVKVLDRIDAIWLIDDAGHNIISAANAGYGVLMLDKPWNAGICGNNIIRVKNWKQIERVLLNGR